MKEFLLFFLRQKDIKKIVMEGNGRVKKNAN
jgi:hypothetical protein